MVGGGSKSGLWRQTIADAFGVGAITRPFYGSTQAPFVGVAGWFQSFSDV